MRLNTDRNLLLSTVGFERLFDTFNNLSSGGFEHKNPSYPPIIYSKNQKAPILLRLRLLDLSKTK